MPISLSIRLRLSARAAGGGGGPVAPTVRAISTNGESNASGRSNSDGLGGYAANVLALNTAGTAMASATGAYMIPHNDGGNTSGKMGWQITYADDFRAAYPSTELDLIGSAQGLTGFKQGQWAPSGSAYLTAKARTEGYFALTGKTIDEIQFDQGESDGGTLGDWSGSTNFNRTYDLDLGSMIDTMRSSWAGCSANTAVVLSTRKSASPSWQDDPAVSLINWFTEGVAERRTKISVADGWTGMVMEVGDTAHYNAASQRTRGHRFYAASVAAQAKAAISTPPATLVNEWVLGADNAGMAAVGGGSALTALGVAPTHNSGYLALGTAGNGTRNALSTGFTVPSDFSAVVMAKLTTSTSQCVIGRTAGPAAVNMIRANNAGSVGIATGTNPFTDNSGQFTGSTTGYELYFINVANGRWSNIIKMNSGGIAAAYTLGFTNPHTAGGVITLGTPITSGTNYKGPTEIAWAGVWAGQLSAPACRELYTRLVATTLAGRGLTFI